jgi:hypothetical protein
MQSSSRLKTVTASVTAKVTPGEEKLCRARAEEAGLSLSEWSRGALIRAASFTPETRLLLAELMALRAVILPLHAEILKGNKLTDTFIAETMKQADARKFAMAENRLLGLREKEK